LGREAQFLLKLYWRLEIQPVVIAHNLITPVAGSGAGWRYRWRIRKRGENAMGMSDKLQFVAGFHDLSTAESHDKLKFVGHFWIGQRYHMR
jgi:hypothetical protein